MYKRSVIIILLVLIMLVSTFVLAQSSGEEDEIELDFGDDSEETTVEEQGIPEAETPDAFGAYTEGDDETPAEIDFEESTVTEPTTYQPEEPEELTLTTPQGSSTATYEYFVADSNGVYEAAISGVAAGTTMYFLSYFDDKIFKFTAGEDEAEVRVIQFQTNGSSQERMYIELAEGDYIGQGDSYDNQDYHFYAYDDASVYVYNSDETTEVELGEHAYTGDYNESFENPTEDTIETQLTDQGFYEVTLPKNASYKYVLEHLNLTLSNINRRDISICKSEGEECDVYNLGNKFIITGKDRTLKQDDYLVVESFDPNNVIEIDFAEETAYLSNSDPEKEVLATFKMGYHEVQEMEETIYSYLLDEEYPYLFRSYDSDNPIPELVVDSTNTLMYEDDDNKVNTLPHEEAMKNNCIEYVYNNIMGEDDEEKPSYC